jgi:transcriptional regulator with XRE-family HTH domain
MSEVHERLRLAREQAGLSQGQVAKRLNMSRPTISEIEAGRRRVDADELRELSKLYEVSVDWLVSEQGDSPAEDAKVQLAARGLATLRPDDLDTVLRVLKTIRRKQG